MIVAIPATAPASGAATSLLARGILNFQRGELRTAVKLLQQAVARVRARHERAKAHLYAGLARAYLNQVKLAEQHFVRAVMHDPGIEPETDRIPPRVAALLQKARRSLSGILEIHGTPEGGKAEIGDTGSWSLPFRQKVPAASYEIRVFDASGAELLRSRILIRPGTRKTMELVKVGAKTTVGKVTTVRVPGLLRRFARKSKKK